MNYYYFFLYIVLRLVKRLKLKKYAHRSLEDATIAAFMFINVWLFLFVINPILVFNFDYFLEIRLSDEKTIRYAYYLLSLIPLMIIQYITYFHNGRWIGIYRKYHKFPKREKIRHTIILTSLLFVIVIVSIIFNIVVTIPFIRSQ